MFYLEYHPRFTDYLHLRLPLYKQHWVLTGVWVIYSIEAGMLLQYAIQVKPLWSDQIDNHSFLL